MKKIDISTKKYPKTYALVDDEDFEYINQWKWHPDKNRNTFYACRNSNKEERDILKTKKIYMHRVILKCSMIDHIDRNGLNNTRSNLRETNLSENKKNSHKTIRSHLNTHSKYKYISKDRGKFTLIIKGKYIKCFKTEKEALCRREKEMENRYYIS